MKKIIYFFVLITTAITVSAQLREDTIVHILPVEAQDPAHAAFFKQNFNSETAAAGYTITENANEADYSIKLRVTPNMVLYDDGSTEQAPPGEPQYLLHIVLLDNENNNEIVSFDFPFTELEEMYDYNLYLLYQAMANVPVTKITGLGPEGDRWRNKWLYIRVSFDYPVVTTYQLKPDGLYGGSSIYDGNINNPDSVYKLDHIVRALPGATVGLELQFLNWMSAEAGFLLRFGDPLGDYSFIPGLYGQIKFPIKPATYFMLEPYLAVSVQANTSDHFKDFPPLSIGGGFQFGVKGGNSGALIFDLGFLYTAGDVVTNNPQPAQHPNPSGIHYARYLISFGIGYKIGLFDR